MFTESECDSEHDCLVSLHVIQHITSLTGNRKLSLKSGKKVSLKLKKYEQQYLKGIPILEKLNFDQNLINLPLEFSEF